MSSGVVRRRGSGICSRSGRVAVALQRALPRAGAEAALLWKAVAAETFVADDGLRLLDTTPLPAASRSRRPGSELAPGAGFGYCRGPLAAATGASSSCCSAASDGTIVDFDLVPADPPNVTPALTLLEATPIAGAHDICDEGFAGAGFEAAVTSYAHCCCGQAAADEPDRPNPPIGWIRQRIESIVNSLKEQLLLGRPRRPHPGRPARQINARDGRALSRHQAQATTRRQQPRTRRLRR